MWNQISQLIDNDICQPQCQYWSGIIGINPSSGARSPRLWNRAFGGLNIDCRMVALDVSKNRLNTLLELLRDSPDFIGGAIAVPYKEDVCSWLGSENLTQSASSVGAVNILFRCQDGRLMGGNSDALGFIGALERENVVLRDDDSVLMIGLGGAGKAVLSGLRAKIKTGRIYVTNRTARDELRFWIEGSECVTWIPWSERHNVLRAVKTVINCTILGGALRPFESPIDWSQIDHLTPGLVAFDVNYDPAVSQFLVGAKSRDLSIVNGMAMNQLQAVYGFYSATRQIASDVTESEIFDLMAIS